MLQTFHSSLCGRSSLGRDPNGSQRIKNHIHTWILVGSYVYATYTHWDCSVLKFQPLACRIHMHFPNKSLLLTQPRQDVLQCFAAVRIHHCVQCHAQCWWLDCSLYFGYNCSSGGYWYWKECLQKTKNVFFRNSRVHVGRCCCSLTLLLFFMFFSPVCSLNANIDFLVVLGVAVVVNLVIVVVICFENCVFCCICFVDNCLSCSSLLPFSLFVLLFYFLFFAAALSGYRFSRGVIHSLSIFSSLLSVLQKFLSAQKRCRLTSHVSAMANAQNSHPGPRWLICRSGFQLLFLKDVVSLPSMICSDLEVADLGGLLHLGQDALQHLPSFAKI